MRDGDRKRGKGVGERCHQQMDLIISPWTEFSATSYQ